MAKIHERMEVTSYGRESKRGRKDFNEPLV